MTNGKLPGPRHRGAEKAGGGVDPQKRPANDKNAALRGAATGSARRLQPFRKARPADGVQITFHSDALFMMNTIHKTSASNTSASHSRRADT